ncbi:unnamed protein product [Linum trigynum]|uniref:Transmembrane protein n=1 Tax=Linum trigynum TaxID=586398 RepID=A0AAV2EAD6_9ROSI
MEPYHRLLLFELHFNPPSPLLPSLAVQYPCEFKSSGILPPTTAFTNWSRRGPTRRLRYNFRDELFTDDSDDRYGGFRSGGASSTKRVWWLDDDDEDADSDFDSDSWEVDDTKNEFPLFKVMAALGWMFPAIAVSMLVGTDQNALLMALAVPLGQTVVSLVVDKLWGRSTYEKRPKTRSWTQSRKKRPFSKTASTTETRARKEQDEEEEERRSNGSGNGYQSWVAKDGDDDGAHKKRDSKGGPGFGGWDELDRVGNETPRTKTTTMRNGRKVDGQRKQGNRVRMSRRRVREKPLLFRMLVAVFPFMSSWTGFLL